MRFSENPDYINRLANDPEIFAKIAQRNQSCIDLSVGWEHCIGIEFDEGAFLFVRIAPRLYEAHTLFKPGKTVSVSAKLAIHTMFCATDCDEIITRVPRSNRAANILARKSGLTYRYSIPNGWPGLYGDEHCDHFYLSLWEWIIGNQQLAKLGTDFCHASKGSVCDCFAGYAAACALLGNLDRGITEYNTWANASGFNPLDDEQWRLMADRFIQQQYGQANAA